MSPRRARRLPGSVPRRGRGGVAAARASRSVADGAEEAAGPQHTESWPDGDWVVRLVPGRPADAAAKPYRCPGCDQEIPAQAPHLVAWPALRPGVEERRHWHRACWERRMHRRPGGRRTR